MKKILIYIVLVIVILFGVFFLILKNKKENIAVVPTKEPVGMCYQYSKETSRGYVDRVWLKMDITGDNGENVTGEYQTLLAEKDSKVGKISGTIGPMDPKISGRIADVWWDSLGEGMNVTEQLKIQFGEGSAVALGGEMVDRGDGTYIYKDVTKLTPGIEMSQIDCESLNDQNLVEKYVRENISTIVSEKPVLGGTWYATVVNISPSTKSGTLILTYEDGHIQKKGEFSYTINGSQITVNQILPHACYKYHQVATTSTLYAVDEYIDITTNGIKISGIKKGNQKGPDMTNGYTGTIEGTLSKGLITAIFSYTIEGSQGKEKELYKIVSTGLQKLRYPLKDEAGILVPDITKKFTALSYTNIDCSLIK